MTDAPSDPVAAAMTAFFGLSGMRKDGANLLKVEQLAAAIDSANYLNTEMHGCKLFATDLDLLKAAMAERTIEGGLVLEFGVYSGRTINHLAAFTEKVFGFDSFQGLPEDWRTDIRKSAFKRADLPQVKDNAELVIGLFDSTLPNFVATHPGPVSFLHVDCDLYSSTKTIFEFLTDRIVPGTVIVFDEYFNYVGWRNHEYKAFKEFVAARDLKYRYIGARPAHQQVGVIIL